MLVSRSGYKLSGYLSLRSKRVSILRRIRSFEFTSALPLTAGMRRSSNSAEIVRGQGRKFLAAGPWAFLAACLALGMVASIVLEAFDGDSDLWQFGAEDFDIAAHANSLRGTQPIGGVSTLNAALFTVMTAGAYLVLRHRPRSALAADSPLTSIASILAESWGLHRLVLRDSAILVSEPFLTVTLSRTADAIEGSGLKRLTARHAKDRRARSVAIIRRAAFLTGGRR